MLGAPELDSGLQVESHESRVKGQNPLHRPAGHASLDAAQDMIGFLGCKNTLPAHAKRLIHQYPQVLPHRNFPSPCPFPGFQGSACSVMGFPSLETASGGEVFKVQQEEPGALQLAFFSCCSLQWYSQCSQLSASEGGLGGADPCAAGKGASGREPWVPIPLLY